MTDQMEQRLTAAAEALREHELATRRDAELGDRLDELETRLVELRAQHAEEQGDVERLEGLSLTRVLAALRGNRDDALARERAEVAAVEYRVAEVEARLAAVRQEHEANQARLKRLASAPTTYAAVLDERERYLGESGDPRGARLLDLADERGRLAGEAREISEAQRAAGAAAEALAWVEDRLRSASDWSTYDTFFGGGVIASAIKHSRLDEVARAASSADRCLAVLRTELSDVPGMASIVPLVAVGGFTRFADVWFDNIFTDLSVRDQIKLAQRNVTRSVQLVDEVRGRLRQRAAQAQDRLAAIEAERHDLLTCS